MKLIKIQIALIVALTMPSYTAGAQYLGPKLQPPITGGGNWLVFNGTGDKAITATHRGNGFYSLDWDDLTLNGSVSGANLVSPAPGFIEFRNIRNTNCPNTWGTENVSYGCKIVINHGAGYETFLGHLVQGSIPFTNSSYVAGGAFVGVMGMSGYASGTHVHDQKKQDGDGRENNILLQGIRVGGILMRDYQQYDPSNPGSTTPFYPGFTPNPHLTHRPSPGNPVSCVSVDASIGNGELYGCQSLANRHGGGYVNLAKDADRLNPAYDIYAGETITTFFEVIAKRDVQFRIIGYRERTGQPYETRPRWIWESQPRIVSWTEQCPLNPAGWTPEGQIIRQAHQLENTTLHAALKAPGTSELWTRWIFRVFVKLDENDNGLSDDSYQPEPEFIFSYRVKRNPDGTCSPDNRCPQGQGHCEEDEDCTTGLVCQRNIGAQFGKQSFTGVCVPPGTGTLFLATTHPTPPIPPITNSYTPATPRSSESANGANSAAGGRVIETPSPPPLCTPADWQCSDWLPVACSPWGARTRSCTLRNRTCLNPVRPVEVESCPATACTPGLIHVAGGNPEAVRSDVLYTDIQCPGTIRTFQRTTAQLHRPLVGLGLARVGDCLVIPGGVRPRMGPVAEVWIGRIRPSGDVHSWNQAQPLPSPRGWHSVFTWQNQVCVTAGYYNRQSLNDVLCAPVDPTQCRLTSDWYSVLGPGFSCGRYTAVATVIDSNKLFVGSGWCNRASADVQLADLRLTNRIIGVEPWISQPELQTPRFEGAGACTGGRCFLAGGANDPGGNGNQTLGSVEMTGLTATGLSPWSLSGSFSPSRRALAAFTYHDRFCIAGGVTGSGEHLADIQCAPIQARDLGPFASAGSLGAPRSSFGLVVGPVVGSAVASALAPPTTAGQTTRATESPTPPCAPGQIHVIGGGTDKVRFTDIDCADGELLPWRETGPFPRRIAEHGAVRVGRFIVVVGGIVPGASGALRLTTIGRIDPTGAVTAWLDSDRLLPVPLRNHAVFYYPDHRQVCAVSNSSSGGTIYCVLFDEVNGILGDDWYQASGPAYPGQREAAATALVGNRLWLFGGWGSGRPLSDAQAATLGQTNGRLIISTGWTQPGQFSTPRFEHAVAGTDQAIYLAGGTDDGNGASALSDTTIVLLNPAGAIDRIITGPSFSPGRWELTLNRYGPYLYLIGGRTGAGRDTALAEVLRAEIQPNLYLGNWIPASNPLPSPTTGHVTVVGAR